MDAAHCGEPAAQKQQSNKEKHALPFPVLFVRQIPASVKGYSAPFVIVFGHIYICYVDCAMGARAWSKDLGAEALSQCEYRGL